MQVPGRKFEGSSQSGRETSHQSAFLGHRGIWQGAGEHIIAAGVHVLSAEVHVSVIGVQRRTSLYRGTRLCTGAPRLSEEAPASE